MDDGVLGLDGYWNSERKGHVYLMKASYLWCCSDRLGMTLFLDGWCCLYFVLVCVHFGALAFASCLLWLKVYLSLLSEFHGRSSPDLVFSSHNFYSAFVPTSMSQFHVPSSCRVPYSYPAYLSQLQSPSFISHLLSHCLVLSSLLFSSQFVLKSPKNFDAEDGQK